MRLALAYFGPAPKPETDMKRMAEMPGVIVLDDCSPNVVVVEGPAEVIRRVNKMPSWAASEETAPHGLFPSGSDRSN